MCIPTLQSDTIFINVNGDSIFQLNNQIYGNLHYHTFLNYKSETLPQPRKPVLFFICPYSIGSVLQRN